MRIRALAVLAVEAAGPVAAGDVALPLPQQLRHRHLVDGVHAGVRLRRIEGRVRATEAAPGEEGALGGVRQALQVLPGVLPDPVVHVLVCGEAVDHRPRLLAVLRLPALGVDLLVGPGALALQPRGVDGAQLGRPQGAARGDRPAGPLAHGEGHLVQPPGRHHVDLAERGGAVAGLLQALHHRRLPGREARRGADLRLHVVDSVLVHVAPGHDAGPAGDADGVLDVAAGEARPPRGEGVQVGRPHPPPAGAAQGVVALLVRGDQEDGRRAVGRSAWAGRHRLFSLFFSPPPATIRVPGAAPEVPATAPCAGRSSPDRGRSRSRGPQGARSSPPPAGRSPTRSTAHHG